MKGVERQGSARVRVRVAGGILLVTHLLIVGWLALRPLDVPFVAAANLEVFAGIRADLELGAAEAARRIGGGLLLLAPLGFLLPMAGGSITVSTLGSLIRTVAAGALISLGIELLQTGVAGRVMDVDSLLLNTAGVALAHLLVVPACRAGLRRRKERAAAGRPVAGPPVPAEETPQGATPKIPRVGIAP
ncbi:VanZ family protein [Streptomyces qinzhouensis]|uniref:VanZ family protein n=1 Tax=Streptomyces qinzhouensis TaxID=2599401 RepID=A0A5B8IJK0_9ACTN|nr:VanZ family protein [Streptomyces qinzhouensis]QDY78672.1 VanZ family protein [Streptomyces qinzhouensis]